MPTRGLSPLKPAPSPAALAAAAIRRAICAALEMPNTRSSALARSERSAAKSPHCR